MPFQSYTNDPITDPDVLSVVEEANRIIEAYAEQGFDLTLRQLYYRFIATDKFPDDRRWRQDPNTKKWVRDQNGTKNAFPNYKWLGTIISDARMCGMMDWARIVDRTREYDGGTHWDSPSDIIHAVARQFRIDKWDNQEFRVEVWVEKDALEGVLIPICKSLDVGFFSCRGYTSQSSMWQAGQRLRRIIESGQKPVIIHLGDHDSSGVDMTRDVQDRLTIFAEEEIQVDRIALTMKQIRQYNPPPAPAKPGDSRSKKYVQQFGKDVWELDALEPNVLADLVRKAVTYYRDDEAWEKKVEEESKHIVLLRECASRWDDIVKFLNKKPKK